MDEDPSRNGVHHIWPGSTYYSRAEKNDSTLLAVFQAPPDNDTLGTDEQEQVGTYHCRLWLSGYGSRFDEQRV